MKAFTLARIPAPPPRPEPKLCIACKAFRAECVVPVGEASAPMCWLCAHHVVDHECDPGDAATAECECLPHEIYPGREAPTVDELIQERLRYQHGDVDYSKPRTSEEMLRGSHLGNTVIMRAPGAASASVAKIYLNNGTAEPRTGYTGPVGGMKDAPIWADEPREARSRVCHCGVCGAEGHYAKTCPTVRRGR